VPPDDGVGSLGPSAVEEQESNHAAAQDHLAKLPGDMGADYHSAAPERAAESVSAAEDGLPHSRGTAI